MGKGIEIMSKEMNEVNQSIEAKADAVVIEHFKNNSLNEHAIVTVKGQIEVLDDLYNILTFDVYTTRVNELKAILKNLEDRLQ